MSFCLLTNVILYHPIFEMYCSICDVCKSLIVCYNDKSLTELIT